MKRSYLGEGAVAFGLAAGGVVMAGPANAAPTPQPNTQDPQETINNLQDDGFRVIVSRVGSGSMSDCTVASVRPGSEVPEVQAGALRPAPGSGQNPAQPSVSHTTVHVDLVCYH